MKKQLAISENCALEFIDSPGHANHHFSIFNPISKGIFTGDVLGIFNEGDLFGRFCLPSTSPTQFNPEVMIDSAARLESYRPEVFFLSHFGLIMFQIRYLPNFGSCCMSSLGLPMQYFRAPKICLY
ncbi:MBL fold metallo-hydrolase [Bacillus sp. SJS]|uniref:MBL fold metallo-hydrolase n=1 Tax=Bacillus sp. SJS TaxID=1423321 RepID=UPI003FA406B0